MDGLREPQLGYSPVRLRWRTRPGSVPAVQHATRNHGVVRIEGWTTDDRASAFAAYLNSCKVMVRGVPAGRERSEFYAALQSVCRRAINAHPRDAAAARAFFEANFRPMRIAPLGESNGFLTGYYEPIISGSRVADDE